MTQRDSVCMVLAEGAEDNGAPNGVTNRCYKVRPCPDHDVRHQVTQRDSTEGLEDALDRLSNIADALGSTNLIRGRQIHDEVGLIRNALRSSGGSEGEIRPGSFDEVRYDADLGGSETLDVEACAREIVLEIAEKHESTADFGMFLSETIAILRSHLAGRGI